MRSHLAARSCGVALICSQPYDALRCVPTMAMPEVLTDAARHDRSFAQPQALVSMRSNPPLLVWRRLLNHAVAEAKKTLEGLPTDLAILARWWIADLQPTRHDHTEWERSFACACHWLDIDATKERKRLVREIDDALKLTWMEVWFRLTYMRRAMVLTCAGRPTAIAGQFLLPLASESTYDEVAGIDKPDMFAEMEDVEVGCPIEAYACVWPRPD
jgi:hypothetical protein